MANMTQAEIDALVGEMAKNDGQAYTEVECHALICRYCRKVTFSEDLTMHVILTRRGCARNEYGHMFLSEGRLRQMKERPFVAGWRVKEPPVSTVVKRKVVAVSGKGGGGAK